MFDLSRVILNSRALNNDSGVLQAHSHRDSSYRGHGESIPDDSLFNPSQDPIRVHETDNKINTNEFMIESQHESTAIDLHGNTNYNTRKKHSIIKKNVPSKQPSPHNHSTFHHNSNSKKN